MPGLIDCHLHAYASDVSVQRIEAQGPAYRTAHAVRMLGHALDCGFTTVRDIGGGDHSLARAVADGLVRGPRYLYSGKVLSMTGGHGDMRPIDQPPHYEAGSACACGTVNSFAVMADGVDACLRAAREELRQGAHCIKIMGSGGVASPTDPIWMNQYREDEIRTIVGECAERRSYVSAHSHPASAVRRCVEFGVRVIEHATLIDDATARFVAERSAYVVPTMVIIFALVEMGRQLGFPPQSQEKVEQVYHEAIAGLDRMRQAGVKLAYGTDLLAACAGIHAARAIAPGNVHRCRGATEKGRAGCDRPRRGWRPARGRRRPAEGRRTAGAGWPRAARHRARRRADEVRADLKPPDSGQRTSLIRSSC